ncbi:MAG TPA: M12 family metallo-peptidase [Phenylobacterium sp.]
MRNVAITPTESTAFASARGGQVVNLRLNPRVAVRARTVEVQALAGGRQLWRGEVEGAPPRASSSLIVVNGARMTGTIVAPNGHVFRIFPGPNGRNITAEIDYDALPPDHDPADRLRLSQVASIAALTADANATIDLLVAYTSAAQTASGDIDSLIDLAVQESNQGFANSQVNARFRVVRRLAVAYNESGRSYATIDSDMAGTSDGQMDNLHAERDASGADVVVLIVDQSDLCGRAQSIGGDAAGAFVAVHHGCATGYYSFAHEIGHVVGTRHDLESDSTLTPFAYGHALRRKKTTGGWRTIMGYNCEPAPSQCPTRINYWSNPSVTYDGVALGSTDRENNARVWNERAATVAGFRTAAVAGPPFTPGAGQLYQLHNNGRIWAFRGAACSGASCPSWTPLDNNPRTRAIAAAGANLYQLHVDGRIWRYTGQSCGSSACPGWQLLDNNPHTVAIAAGGGALYQLHNDGKIWRYTGTACSGSSCPGWQLLDNNPATVQIVADGSALYQRHNSGRIWRFLGAPCSGNSCPSWQMLDNNGATSNIVAGGGALYQLHSGGRIWRHTGVACTGEQCPGWTMLDNNGATVQIAASSGGLFQRHGDGRIWRFTGTACSGASCPGWTMLDNNGATVEIVASSSGLYQRHNSGRLWRSTGTACSGNSCPGWELIDNNPATVSVTAARQ